MIRTLATSQKKERKKKSGFFYPQFLVKLLLPKSQKKNLILELSIFYTVFWLYINPAKKAAL